MVGSFPLNWHAFIIGVGQMFVRVMRKLGGQSPTREMQFEPGRIVAHLKPGFDTWASYDTPVSRYCARACACSCACSLCVRASVRASSLWRVHARKVVYAFPPSERGQVAAP